MAKKRNAHTLVELVIILIILATLAAVAIPRLQFSTLYRKQADTVARKIVTDLRRARQLAISEAATNPNGFALTITGSTYQIVDLSTGTAIPNGTFPIAPKISCSGGTNFQFGPLGNLKAGSDSQLAVSAEERTYTINITSATGMVQCTGN
ncbi:MAG: hypothetical protein WC476_06805 [Phycisphaerae bacterium]|jgi:Tfp pilus assembly protein FimT